MIRVDVYFSYFKKALYVCQARNQITYKICPKHLEKT